MFQYDYYPSLLLSYSLILSRSSNLGIIKAPTTSPLPLSPFLPTSNFQLPTPNTSRFSPSFLPSLPFLRLLFPFLSLSYLLILIPIPVPIHSLSHISLYITYVLRSSIILYHHHKTSPFPSPYTILY